MSNLLARALVSLVVPPVCVGCREPELSGSAVCPRCERLLVSIPEPRCLTCGAPLVSPGARPGRAGERCSECGGRSLAFRRAWSAFTYEGVARRLVGMLKSRGALSAAGFMGAQVAARAPGSLLEGTLVPVPAHRCRRRRHGFNQATELARATGHAAGLPVLDLLRRDAASVAQTGLERRARLASAGHSIRVHARRLGGRGGLPSPLVLVDDVYTTGATLDACARALHEAGASEIVALTFARAVRSDPWVTPS
jgi:predicted amidophosphoribosyltransferase